MSESKILERGDGMAEEARTEKNRIIGLTQSHSPVLKATRRRRNSHWEARIRGPATAAPMTTQPSTSSTGWGRGRRSGKVRVTAHAATAKAATTTARSQRLARHHLQSG